MKRVKEFIKDAPCLMFLLWIIFVINEATAQMKVNDTPIIFEVNSLYID